MDRDAEVAARLRQAEAAHGEYEARELGGVFDERWAEWYAGYLLEHGIRDQLPEIENVGDLAARLRECDQAYQQAQPREDWPEFYARRLLTKQQTIQQERGQRRGG